MAAAMQGLVAEAKKNKFSTIGNCTSDEDVASVWENVSNFIEKQMNQQKGVHIQGLGTFTFTLKKLDVGNNKYILIQRPVFMLSEKVAQTHGLNFTKHHVSGQIPVVQLNFAALSFDSPFDRDCVEACVKEVLGALQRSINAKKNVEFTFSGIGRLQIRESKVKMKFYKEFINSMDGSGRLVDSLKDRPGTMDSVMSDRAPSRSMTSNTFVLPRITSDQLGLIPEEEPMEPAETDADILKTDDVKLEDVEPILDVEDDKKIVTARGGSRMTAPIAKATGVSFHDDLMPMGFQTPRGLKGVTVLSKSSATPLGKRSLSPINSPGTPRPGHVSPPDDNPTSKSFLRRPVPLSRKIPSPPATARPHTSDSCGHSNAGQELCYLCHQRARRNIAVSFTEERSRREQEEDKLLRQYQHMKDSCDILEQQETQQGRQHANKRMAAFNLGVSEAIKSKKNTRDTNFHPSYVFQKRSLTPPRFIKQDLYSNDLAEQVNIKAETQKKRVADEEFLERLEQVQLAEDLAAQREQHLQDKFEQQEQYRRALSAQIHVRDGGTSPAVCLPKRPHSLTLPRPKIINPFSQNFNVEVVDDKKIVLRLKPTEIPARVADSDDPFFGRNDMNNEKMAERRRHAHELYQEQLGTVEQRKREAILRRLQEQRDEEEMLKRTKGELLEDRAERYQRMYGNRKRLEDDWFQAGDTKRHRETEERLHTRSAGMLLHEQCDKYRRCGQCKRQTLNCGESNIWRESRYIPGSRLMV